MNGDNETLYTT